MLNFGDQMGTSALSVVWPQAITNPYPGPLLLHFYFYCRPALTSKMNLRIQILSWLIEQQANLENLLPWLQIHVSLHKIARLTYTEGLKDSKLASP